MKLFRHFYKSALLLSILILSSCGSHNGGWSEEGWHDSDGWHSQHRHDAPHDDCANP